MRLAKCIVFLCAALLCGCKDSGQKQLVIFAASSLTDAFAELERELESEQPALDVVVSTGGSQALRVQIEQGAAADVFASANAEHIDALHEAGLVAAPVAFTKNALVVVVPHDNPARIEAFEDLPRAQRIVLGGDTVPVGKYTQELLGRTDDAFETVVLDHVVSREANVRLVVAKVELGEADAAIVYRSDVAASRDVKAIAIPDTLAPTAEYFVAPLQRSTNPELARAVVDRLVSERGQALLQRHGFGP
jgi:molybdate transport system substrate-binding protein